jgi:hypothetical protein
MNFENGVCHILAFCAKLLNPSKQKSVKLLVIAYFLIAALENLCRLISTKQFTPIEREPSQLILIYFFEIFQISD